jgi:hypothetical protein
VNEPIAYIEFVDGKMRPAREENDRHLFCLTTASRSTACGSSRETNATYRWSFLPEAIRLEKQ